MNKSAVVWSIVLSLLAAAADAGQPPALAVRQPAKDMETPAPPGYRSLKIRPSRTDPGISAFDYEHRVIYDPKARDDKILLFLTGTTDKPGPGPRDFFRTALAQGYRVINLVYISYPAVSEICRVRGAELARDPDCAAHFRQRRIYGDIAFPAIPDKSQDAIVPRLSRLLEYLARTDPDAGWQRYLDRGRPVWDRIAVAGQSQGGGMAEYLGKKETLARVISFSGGWDYAGPGRIASWYSTRAATPPERWYAAYHAQEPFADDLRKTYAALDLPAGHVLAFDKPLDDRARQSRMPGHGSGIRDVAYQPDWVRMLGRGRSLGQ